MDLKEAKLLVVKINKIGCDGEPLAVYDGRVSGNAYGEARALPVDTDPGIVMCRKTVEGCIFCGGSSCPSGLTGSE